MAFNLSALKNLFGKLAPYAGTALQVADTGMGIAAIASSLGGGASNPVDDIPMSDYDLYGTTDDKVQEENTPVTIRGKQFHYPTSGPYLDTKTRLLDNQLGIDRDPLPKSIYLNPHKNTALGRWYAKNKIV